jgi:16S rRNA (cytosine1402-N4)-methyltransferase
VNRELDVIPTTLAQLVDHLKPGGRLCVITFHSLEDRVVKECIRDYIEGCTCPRDFPVCVCGFQPKLKNVTRKPIVPGKEEETENPRSRSAKLRIAEKL